MFMKIWNYLRGYVIIKVEGFFVEKFLNICIHRDMRLWNVRRVKPSIMEACISIKDFKRVRPVAKKSRCKVRIKRKQGLPFFVYRHRYRKTFLAGAFAFFISLYLLTSFVWNIEVSGNNKLTNEYLTDVLNSNGVKIGVFKGKINVEKLVTNMMLQVKDLAWVGVELKGTKLKVHVAERVETPQIVPKDKPCDIYATKDGIIKTVVAKAGMEMVKPGTTVKKGQLLVTGVVPNKNPQEPSRIVHAMAVVKARTWYEEMILVETNKVEKERSNNVKSFYYLNLLNKRIKIIPGKMSFELFDKEESVKTLSLGKDLELPFSLTHEKYYEIIESNKEIDIEEAKITAMNKAYESVVAQIPEGVEIIKTERHFIDSPDGKTYAQLTLECLEDIGEAKEIGGK